MNGCVEASAVRAVEGGEMNMPRIEIEGRHTGDVLLTVNSKTLSGADLHRADLSEADLRQADLSEATLSHADLSEADLHRANLSDANLRWADLRGADLRGADLSGADLGGATMGGANLRWADLRQADLRGADLTDADLSGADLRWATGNGREVITLQLGRYHVVVAGERMTIDSHTRLITDWLALNEADIEQLGGNAAVGWAATWRPVIEEFLMARVVEAFLAAKEKKAV